MALVFMLASCVEAIEQSVPAKNADYQAKREMLTKSLADDLSQGVTKTDVEDYLAFRMSISLDDVKDITRFDIDETAYVFIVNMNRGGWYIFSGDYSSVPVIARGEGFLNMSNVVSKRGGEWMQTISGRIVENKNLISDEVMNNRAEWTRVKYLSTTHRNSKHKTRNDPYDSYLVYDTLNYVYYPTMTVTSWDQYPPFNNAMPKLRYGSDRCLAGCAVIAIAQLLFYTHGAFGFPSVCYSHASCNQYYDEGPAYNFNLTSPVNYSWYLMYNTYSFLDTDPYVPALCAQIADRSRTTYGVVYPYASLSSNSYGETKLDSIPGTLGSFSLNNVHNRSFSIDSIVNELANNRPVLSSGTMSDTSSFGHSYLIDGYYWLRVKETEYELDDNGAILGEIVNIYDEKKWSVNTGKDDPSHHMWVHEGYYYPANRVISIGWKQSGQ